MTCDGKTRVKTTRCILEELKAGGELTRGALVNARKFDCIQCCGGKVQSPTDCIKGLIGGSPSFLLLTLKFNSVSLVHLFAPPLIQQASKTHRSS